MGVLETLTSCSVMKIVVDGNIGAGKSTQLCLLESAGYSVKREPIDEWSLDLFYEDQSRWALLLQMQILNSFSCDSGNVVYERCPLSSNYVFWKNLVNNGVVTKPEDAIYQKYYEKMSWYPDLYIYLATTPEYVYERIQSRHQAGDSKITLEYLTELHTLYCNFLRCVPCKVRSVVVAGRTPEQIHQEIISIIRVENAVFVFDRDRSKVSKMGGSRRKVSCTSFANMCSMS